MQGASLILLELTDKRSTDDPSLQKIPKPLKWSIPPTSGVIMNWKVRNQWDSQLYFITDFIYVRCSSNLSVEDPQDEYRNGDNGGPLKSADYP